MNKKMSFRQRVLIAFVSLALIGMGIASFISANMAMSIAKSLTLESLEVRTRSIQELLQFAYEDQLARQKALVESWVPRIVPRLSLTPSKEIELASENQVTRERTTLRLAELRLDGKVLRDHRLVDEVSQVTGDAVTFFLMAPEGMVRVSTSVRKADGSRGVHTFIPSESPVYQSVSKGEVYYGMATVLDRKFVSAYVPWQVGGKVVGAIFMGTPESGSERVREMLKNIKLGDNGYFYILDSKGTMVLHPSLEGKQMLEQKDADGVPIFKVILEKKTGILDYRWPYKDGQIVKKLALFHEVPAYGWHVAASIDQDEAFRGVSRLKLVLSIVSVVVALVMVVVTFILIGKIARRFSELESLISSTSGTVESDSKGLSDAAGSLASASNEQAAGLQETVSALEEIRSTIFKNLEQTENSEKLSFRLQEVGKTNDQVVSELYRAMKEIEASNQSVQHEVGKSHEEIRQISSFILDLQKKTEVINDIVFQTKLLSFNASVEASRAGEHGKGFAVVAEEVGSLAALSGSAAKEISSALAESVRTVNQIIEKSSTQVGQLLSDSGEKVRKGVEAAQRCQDALKEMTQGIEENYSAVTSIANASREQSKGVDEISKALQEIDKATQQNAAAATRTENIASSMLGSSTQLEKSVAELHAYLNGE